MREIEKRLICTALTCFMILVPLSCILPILAAPTTVTINSQASLDGYIAKWGRPYPPQDHVDVSATSDSILVGQWRDRDTTQPGYIYCIERGYLSFDTSSIPDYAYIMSVKLKLKLAFDDTQTDFLLQVWSGTGGTQYIYGSSLDAADWGCGGAKKAEYDTAGLPAAGAYFDVPILDAHVNKTGVTQFELKSNREGTSPTGNEDLSLYSSDSVGNEPKLEVTYCEGDVPPGKIDEKFVKKDYTSTRVQLYHDGDEHVPDLDYYAVYITIQNVWSIEQGNFAHHPKELQLYLEMPDWCQEITHDPLKGDYGSLPVSFTVAPGAFGMSGGFSIQPPRYSVDYSRSVSNGKLKVSWNARSFVWWAGIQWSYGRLYDDTITFFFEFEVPENYKPTVAVDSLHGIYDEDPWKWSDPFKCWEDSGWLVVDPVNAPPIQTDPPPSLSVPGTLNHPCNITSYNIYYNDASQNLSSLIKGYSYSVNVQLSWFVNQAQNATLTVRLYDAAGNKVASSSKQYNPINYANYVETLTLNVASSATTGLGKINITLTSKDPEAANSEIYAHPTSGNVNIISSNNSPNTPSSPSGPSSGYVWYTYGYSTSTTDPNNDYVRYEFAWGDSTKTTTGWYASGATATAYHYWSSVGIYYVTVRAQDPYGAWSGSSSAKTVSITSGGGGGCPYLYVWNGTDFVCEGLLDIHNAQGIDVITSHTLTANPASEHGVYMFRLIEHSQTISDIDQVKLTAILQDGRTVQLPLIYARHSEYGNVLPQLLFSDDWRTQTVGADHNNGISQSIQLKFLALPPKLAVVGFIFQIEGNNMIVKV